MKLTDEQQDAIRQPGNVCLFSCPGSGKTRTVAAKLIACLDDVRNTSRRAICITHTNSAADEIYGRVRDLSSADDQLYFDVSTIHSCALRVLLNPFGHLLPEFANGYRIISSEDDVYREKVEELIAAHQLRDAAQDFDHVARGPNGELPELNSIPAEVQQVWCRWLDDNGLTTQGDIVYHANRLISKPAIASALASRFAWIIVDEFQDSSPGQTALFRAINEFGRTRFFCVGDPFQSIYGFSGATPEAFQDFARQIGANVDHRLTGNFRSSRLICARADRLRVADPPMHAIGEAAAWPADARHLRVADNIEAVFDHFLPEADALGVRLGEIAVLANSWFTLWHVAREFRRRGIPAVGPGARPYKRNHLITQLLEPIGAYLEYPEPAMALQLQRALFLVVLVLSQRHVYLRSGFVTRITVRKLIEESASAMAVTDRAVDWIRDVSARFSFVLREADVLSLDACSVLQHSAEALIANILDTEAKDGQALTVRDLGVFARNDHCVQLLTVHRAKGREFEAVALIDANNDVFPHYSVSKLSDLVRRDAGIAESRRVFYVATTRARRLLMFFSGRSGKYGMRPPTQFLKEMGL